MAEESMQAVMQEQYPGWRWDGVQWVQEESGWPGAQQEEDNQQEPDYSSQEPYSNRQEHHGSQEPQEASPEPPGGSSPEQEASPSHTVTDPTPSPPEGFLGFNPSNLSLPPVSETPAYEENAQRATFDLSTLPPPRRTSLTDAPSR